MSHFGFNVLPLSRGKGQSSVAAAAYQSACRMFDPRSRKTHDFTKKTGVLGHGLLLPNQAKVDPEEFWSRVELKHTRGDAVVARTVKLSLPKQLPMPANQDLVVKIASQIAERYGVGVAWAFHAPRYFSDDEVLKVPFHFWEFDPEGRRTNSNFHAHLTISACRVSANAADFQLENKCELLDPISCRQARIENFATVQREIFCGYINSALKKEGVNLVVDHLKADKKKTEHLPGTHLGQAAYEFERRTGRLSKARIREMDRQGRFSADKAREKEIQMLNEKIDALKDEVQDLRREARAIASEPIDFSESENPEIFRPV